MICLCRETRYQLSVWRTFKSLENELAHARVQRAPNIWHLFETWANNRADQKTRWLCVYTHDCACANSRSANPSRAFSPLSKAARYGILIVRLYRNSGTALSSVYHRFVISRRLHALFHGCFPNQKHRDTDRCFSISVHFFFSLFLFSRRFFVLPLIHRCKIGRHTERSAFPCF